MLGMKPQISSDLVFFSTQFFVGELPDGSALLADHEAMAAFRTAQAAFYKSAAGQHFVSKVEVAE